MALGASTAKILTHEIAQGTGSALYPLTVIPVIDIMNGRAVHARRGQRHSYAPLATPLCPDGDALQLIEAFRRFSAVYVADLDAIMTGVPQTSLITTMAERGNLWVDAGSCSSNSGVTVVVGSESLENIDHWRRIAVNRDAVVLSLDFGPDGTFRGPADLWDTSSLWPDRVIGMTLGRVGAEGGPDLDLVGEIRRKAPSGSVFAAGGVRHRADLDQLAQAGADGVLVATALHAGVLD